MRFIRGHVGYLKRRETITPDLWVEEDHGFTTPCWIIVGYRHIGGYVKVQLRGRPVLAHRAMYEQEVGPIPLGLHIDHLCRQPACINPAHLEPVTHAENLRRGNSARLTADDVRAIRAATAPQREIAQRYGITQGHVAGIRARRSWKDV